MQIIPALLFRLRNDDYRIKVMRKKGMTIGDKCLIAANVSFGSEPYLIQIGSNVKMSNGVSFITHDGGVFTLRNYKGNPRIDVFGKIKIGDNVFLGNKSSIMPGVTIGSNCIVGYGAIVTHDIPDNSVVAGVPARVIKSIDEYYEGVKDRILETKDLTYYEKKEIVLKYFEGRDNGEKS